MGELGSTYGLAYLGVCLSCILYGVTNLQAFLYFRIYPDDKLWHKISVCWLWLLDTLHTVFCVYMVYYYVITESSKQISTLHWSLKTQLLLEAVIVPGVYTFYSIRIWRLYATVPCLLKPRPLVIVPGIVTIALFTEYVCSFVYSYEILYNQHMANFFEPSGRWISYYANINSAVVDAVLASALCYLLASCRTGYKRMDSTLGWLMFYVLNTGVVACICAVITVIMVVALPNTMAVVGAQVVQTKLYVNSYLALMNARSSLRLDNPPQSAQMCTDIILRRTSWHSGSLRHVWSHPVQDIKNVIFPKDRWSGKSVELAVPSQSHPRAVGVYGGDSGSDRGGHGWQAV